MACRATQERPESEANVCCVTTHISDLNGLVINVPIYAPQKCVSRYKRFLCISQNNDRSSIYCRSLWRCSKDVDELTLIHSAVNVRSQLRFQVGPHHIFDTTNLCKLHQLSGVGFLTFTIEGECFANRIHADPVAEFKAISQCFFDAVNLHRRVIN